MSGPGSPGPSHNYFPFDGIMPSIQEKSCAVHVPPPEGLGACPGVPIEGVFGNAPKFGFSAAFVLVIA